jgi:hypothetical protein
LDFQTPQPTVMVGWPFLANPGTGQPTNVIRLKIRDLFGATAGATTTLTIY